MSIDISSISSIESEAVVIATLMYHPDYSLFSENLKPSHFVQNDNSILYYSICELYKNGVLNVDIINLYRFISADPKLKDSFTMSVANLDETRTYAEKLARHSVPEYNLLVKTICDLAYRRDMYYALQKSMTYCGVTNNDEILDIKQAVYNELSRVENGYSSFDDLPLLGDIIEELWTETECKQAVNGYVGISSKFPAVVDYYSFDPGEVVLVCGKSGTGKSMMCLNEAIHKLQLPRSEFQDEISILYIDTEMSDISWFHRMLGLITGIPTNKIKSGYYSKEEGVKIEEAKKWVKTKKIVHLYLPVWNTEILWDICKKAQMKYNMNFLIFDYIKSGDEVDANRVYNEMGKTLNFIKNNIAGKMKIPCLCAAQLNRMGGVADSYKLVMYASIVVMLGKKEEKEIEKDGVDCGNYKLFISKNRNGASMGNIEIDYIDLNFQGEIATFSQAKKQHNYVAPQTPYDNR